MAGFEKHIAFMKYSLLLSFAAVSLCFADNPPTQLPDVRTEHVVKRDSDGVVIAYVDTSYRGKERSLQTVKFKLKDGPGWGIWRTYFVGGKAAMAEQEDSDGNSWTISFLDGDGQVREMFRRHQDGSVEPVSSAELAKFLVDQQKFVSDAGKVLDKVGERLQTNSVDQVMQDWKISVQKYKQEQTNGESVDKK